MKSVNLVFQDRVRAIIDLNRALQTQTARAFNLRYRTYPQVIGALPGSLQGFLLAESGSEKVGTLYPQLEVIPPCVFECLGLKAKEVMYESDLEDADPRMIQALRIERPSFFEGTTQETTQETTGKPWDITLRAGYPSETTGKTTGKTTRKTTGKTVGNASTTQNPSKTTQKPHENPSEKWLQLLSAQPDLSMSKWADFRGHSLYSVRYRLGALQTESEVEVMA
jgi:hypothetical protein